MRNQMLATLKFDQRMAISQQLRQAIQLLQYNTLDLKQIVQQYIDSNPLIEVDEVESEQQQEEKTEDNHSEEDMYSFSATSRRNTSGMEDENAYENYAIPKTLRQHLLDQTLLCQFDEDEQEIAEMIIDALDDYGYLTVSLDHIYSLLAHQQKTDKERIEFILKKIQTLDPVGVGARDTRECLLLQLDALSEKNAVWQVAHQLLTEHYDLLSDGKVKDIIKQMKISRQLYLDAIHIIRKLEIHPGVALSNDLHVHVEPELYVKKIKDKWQVFLSESILTNLKIHRQYQSLIKQNKKTSTFQSLKQELNEVKNFIHGLKRRNETLLSVAKYIIEQQTEFLEHGNTHLKSMNIADVAHALELHESTISRITTGKYIATSRGLFELKFFFPSHVFTQSGAMCSDTAVKEHIKSIIRTETPDHVLSDGEIAAILQTKGIKIARRTVAKYRDALQILPSYERMRVLEPVT